VRLSTNQKRMLRAVVRSYADHPYIPYDGNEVRTARSLVRKGLAKWEPEGTNAWLVPTDAGRAKATP
jgi:hypothetical protein